MTVTRGTMVKEVGGWVILSRTPNSIHMSIKVFDGWSADSLIYDALKSDTRSMGCSCGKSSLSPRALNHWSRVDQLHEGTLRYSRLFSSAREYKIRSNWMQVQCDSRLLALPRNTLKTQSSPWFNALRHLLQRADAAVLLVGDTRGR